MISKKDVSKSYGNVAPALSNLNLEIEDGEFVFVVGASGSGKSTMLNCIGGLDTMDSGSVKVDSNEISGLNADELSEYRRANLGFIFQFYNLVPNLTVKENIEICQFLTEDPLDMEELLDMLGLTEHQDKFPAQLSGGQQQRAAIARALAAKPAIILADEPTGNLDSVTSHDVLGLLKMAARQFSQTLILITHDRDIAQLADRIVHIEDGKIVGDTRKGSDSYA